MPLFEKLAIRVGDLAIRVGKPAVFFNVRWQLFFLHAVAIVFFTCGGRCFFYMRVAATTCTMKNVPEGPYAEGRRVWSGNMKDLIAYRPDPWASRPDLRVT